MKNINKILLLTIFILGIVFGSIIRSWSSIVWSQIDYGNVADWVSGLGTIGAIIGSVIFFQLQNKSKIDIRNVTDKKETDKKFEFKFINVGRRTGTFEIKGVSYTNNANQIFELLSEGSPYIKSELCMLKPGEVSKEFKIDFMDLIKAMINHRYIEQNENLGKVQNREFFINILDDDSNEYRISFSISYEVTKIINNGDDIKLKIENIIMN